MMLDKVQRNPFQIIALPIDADDMTIVQRGQEMLESARSEEERQLYQWAIDELTVQPEVRCLFHALNEMPQAEYQDTALDTLLAQSKLNGEKGDDASSVVFTEDDINLPALVEYLLAADLELPASDLADVLAHVPGTLRPAVFPLDMRDVIFG